MTGTGGHAARDHATWSPSASEANFNCPGRIALIDTLQPEDETSEAAAWGTAAHEVAEWALTNNRDVVEFPNAEIAVDGFEIEVTGEVCDVAGAFTGYVRERIDEYELFTGDKAAAHFEKRVRLDHSQLPFIPEGTADAILIFPEWKQIEVVDLKGGVGFVSEVRNKQLGTYGTCARSTFAPLDGYSILTTIVQPRAFGHKTVRAHEWSSEEITKFHEDLRDAITASWLTLSKVRAAPTLEAKLAEAGKETFAGDWCKFCPVSAQCPAKKEQALAVAKTYFTPVGVAAPPAPAALSPDEIVKVLDGAPLLRNWLDDIERYAKGLVEGGYVLEGANGAYEIKEAKGRAVYRSPKTAAHELAVAHKLDVKDLCKTDEPLPPGKMRDKLKKLGVGDPVKALEAVTQSSTSRSLVRSDKNPGKAAKPKVLDYFSDLGEQNDA